MPAKRIFILANLLGLAVALFVYIHLANHAFSFQFCGIDIISSLGFLLFMSYVTGALIGVGSAIPFISGRQVENVAKLKAWQEQDAKLAIEVQSDREKQLEAKIATLESALKQALKK